MQTTKIISKCLIMLLFVMFLSFHGYAQSTPKNIPESSKKLKNPYNNDTKAISVGARVYKKVCWTCHGDNGNGKGPQAAEIETKVADYNDPTVKSRTDGELFYWISNGGNDMQAFKETLTDEEIWKVVSYIRKIQNINPK